MNTNEVANRLVSLCRKGAFDQAIDELYSKDIKSTEPEGAYMQNAQGIDAIREKEKHFNSMIEAYHRTDVSDPLISGNYFTCLMDMDVTMKGHGRTNMEEICVYEVKDGKIVSEQFFYQSEPQEA